MAIKLNTTYPGRADPVSADWPFGEPRNRTTPGTGTPFDEAWFKDVEALKQAMITKAGITPTDIPDTALESQWLEAVGKLYQGVPVASYAAARALDSSVLNDGQRVWVMGFPYAWEVKTGTVTDNGWYLVFADDSNRYLESTEPTNLVLKTDSQIAKYSTAIGAGSVNAYTATLDPVVTSLIQGQRFYIRMNAANTITTPTFSPNGLAAKIIVKGNNLPLVAGDIPGAGFWAELSYDSTFDRWVLANPYVASPDALTFSSSAENIAGTIENKAVDPLGIREAFNATGTAPVYACRAWVNFNGTGVIAIRGSGNVTSITDVGVGLYTVNLTTATSDANSCATTGFSGNPAAGRAPTLRVSSITTSAVGLYLSSTDGTTESAYDGTILCVSIFR